ncbi:Uncharacterised protein [Serratia marcescens]|uniref:hypothetical protein n=1 Tax=Serratia marcescens TaxID=615 RepID=UPI0021784748|nr:hypothetical protein [Serratia marcescens]CAI1563816.1 Uncharacterised protein [Serratia marcescens]
MSYLLRKISISKWQPNLNLSPKDFSADAITGCTKTSENTLSVWKSETLDFRSEEVEKLIVALATTMQAPDTIDLIWLEEQALKDDGINISETPGSSKFVDVNNLHKDLVNINHERLAIVGMHIVNQYNKDRVSHYIRLRRAELIILMKKWVMEKGVIKMDELTPKWIDAIVKTK